jgi:hypothetical protein
MKSDVIEDECPRCFYRTDRANGLDHECSVSAGDVTICLNCGGVFVFSDKLQMREMTEIEAEEIEQLPSVKKAVNLIRQRGFLTGKKMGSR